MRIVAHDKMKRFKEISFGNVIDHFLIEFVLFSFKLIN